MKKIFSEVCNISGKRPYNCSINKDRMTEHDLQVACIKLWDYELCRKYGQPQFALFAIPNGGARNPVVGAKLKAEGVRRGIPDLCLAVPAIPGGDCHYALFMELKVKKNKLTPEQAAFRDYLETDQNYLFREIRSVDDFIHVVDAHLEQWVRPEPSDKDHSPANGWLLDRYRLVYGHEWKDRRDHGW